MPTVFRTPGFRFFFYSNEGQPREPPLVRVEQGESEVKFWLRPEAHLAYNEGFSARALRQLPTLIETNRERIDKAWNEFFG
jgi:hypothetical protein